MCPGAGRRRHGRSPGATADAGALDHVPRPSSISTASPATTSACGLRGLALDDVGCCPAGARCGHVGAGHRQAARRLDAAAGDAADQAPPSHTPWRCRLEGALDRAWAAAPRPAPLPAVTRLNRTQYRNAVRDLFGLDLDVRPLLPGDETADGSFDNLADALSISTAHLERYLSVARQVTRTGHGPAAGRARRRAVRDSDPRAAGRSPERGPAVRLARRHRRASRVSRPSGEYLIKVKLQRQYQEYLKGMGWPQQLDVRLDGKLLKRFVVGGSAKGRPAALSYAGDGEPGFAGDPEWEIYMQTGGDAGLEVRLPVTAGPHVVGVAFVRELWEPEGLVRPPQRGRTITNDNDYMGYANVGEVQIGGPFARRTAAGGAGRRVRVPSARRGRRARLRAADPVARRAPRVSASGDHRRPGHAARVLRQRTPRGRQLRRRRAAGARTRAGRSGFPVARAPRRRTGAVDQFELASRLSFFLWSSIPDARLLDLAERRRLADPAVLAREVRRMLADRRAAALVTDFASQWLNLRRLAEVVVDPDRYPTYDDSLLQAFERETRAVCRQHDRRGSQGCRSADGRLHVRERAAGPSLRHARHLRQPLPPRAAARPPQRGGLLAHGVAAGHHVLSRIARRRCCAASSS